VPIAASPKKLMSPFRFENRSNSDCRMNTSHKNQIVQPAGNLWRVFAALLVVLSLMSAGAQTVYQWNTTTPSSWASSANWTPSSGPGTTIPGVTDTAAFTNLDITAATTVTLDGNQSVNQMIFGDTVTNTAFGWVVSAGTPSTSTVTVAGANPMITVNALGGASIANVTAAILATNLTFVGPGVFNIGSLSSVIYGLNLTNGVTVEFGSGANVNFYPLTFSGNGLFSSGLSSTYSVGISIITNMSGVTSTINVGGRAQLGATNGPSNIGGTLTINVGAQVGSPSRVYMGGTWENTFGTPSTLNFVGTSTTSYVSPSFTGSGGNTAFNSQLTNCTFNFSSSSAGVNKIYMNPANNSTGNTFNMGALSGTGDGILTSSGTGPGTTYSVGMLGTSTTFAGSFQGDCSLTKIGAGTLTLSGNSTNGANAANAVNVNGGGIVGVTGGSFMTPVFTVLTNASFGVQVTTAGGQWTGTNMVFRSGSSLALNFGALSASTLTAPLRVLGNLTVTNVTVDVFGTGIAPGTYPLIQYGTLISGTTGLLTPAVTQPAGLGIALSNGANSIVYMIVTNAAPYITWATNSQNWDIGLSTNWVNYLNNGVVYQQYQPSVGDPVLFGDYTTGYTPVTVTLNTNVAPGSVVVSNTVNAYIISGSGVLGGSCTLTKMGTNTLTLTPSTAWTYSGGVTNAGGTIVLGSVTANASALGTGTVTFNGGTLQMFDNGAGNEAGPMVNNWVVPTGQTGTLLTPQRLGYAAAFSSQLSGGGTFNFYPAATRTIPAGDWSGFTGQININSRYYPTIATLMLNNTKGIPNALVNLTNVSFGVWTAGTYPLGAVMGTNSALNTGNAASCTYVVGGLNTNSEFDGTISGAVSLRKVGTGAWILTGVNTYTGSTLVSNGTLEVDGQISASAVTNYSGSTLSGIGILSSVVDLESGSKVTPGGTNNYGTLTCSGGMVFNGGTNLMDISTTNSDLLAVSGGLSLLGGGTVVLNISGALTNGVYPLITYDSISSGNVSSLHLIPTTLGSKSLSLIDNGSGQIQLQVTAVGNQSLVWASLAEGAANNNWNIETDANWTNAAAPGPLDIFDNGDTVTFNDAGAANSPVNIPVTVAPSLVVVSGTQAYEFSGAGKISGSAQLVVSNYSGTLTLDTFNDYGGATVIKSGTVQVGDGTTLLTSIGTGPVTNNATLVFAQPDTNSASSITGTGNLTLVGGGKTIVTGNATYTGATLVNSNSTLEFGSGGASLIPPTFFTVTNNGTVGFNLSGTLLLTNGITGPGALSLDGPATVTLAGTNNTYLENTWVRNGTLKLGTNNIIPNANTIPGSTGWLILDGGPTAGTVDLNGYNQTVNALSGLAGTVLSHITNSAASGTNVLTINTAVNAGYAGVISDNTNSGRIALVVEGAGTNTLSGANTYSGGTTVNAPATLQLGAATSLGTGMTTLMGGTLGATANLLLYGNSLTVPAGTNGTINMTGMMKLPALYGAGTLAINVNDNFQPGSGSASYGDAFSACANFYGTLNVTGQVATAYMALLHNSTSGGGGTFDGQLQNATVNLCTGVGGVNLGGVNSSGGNTTQFGALNVDANSTLGGSFYAGRETYQIGALGGVSDIEGTVSGNGAITKVGTGTLILNGTDSYTGNTTINSGSVVVGASSFMASSPVITLASNAVLDVSAAGTTSIGATVPQTLAGIGVITGAVSVANSAINPGGVGAVGTLSFSNNLAWTGSVTNNFDIPSTGANDQITVAGTLDIGSGNFFVINALNAVVPAGTYTLATFTAPLLSGGNSVATGEIDQNGGNPLVVLTGSIVSQTRSMQLINTGTAIQLVVSPGNSLTWTGDGSANKWDLATSLDWSGPAAFYQDDSVTFNNSSTNQTVNITGTLGPSAITVNSDSNYVFTSSGKITGLTGLAKSGSGTLTITNTGGNDFTGAINITAGTLKAGVATALGATNGATVITNTGALDVGGFNLGAEPIIVSGAGSGSGAILNSGAAALNALQYVTLAANTTFGGPNRWDIRANTNGSLAGNGYTLTKTGTNDIYLVGLGNTALGNIQIQQGRIGVQDSTLLGTGGILTLASGSGLDFWLATMTNTKSISMTNATISSSSGINVYGGPITLNQTETFTATTPLILSGALNGPGGLLKLGASNLTLTASSGYTGNTTISNGVLALTGTAAITASSNIDLAVAGAQLDPSALAGGTFALSNGQTLKGIGSVKSNLVAGAGSTVAPGESAIGTLTVSNNLALQSGSINLMFVNTNATPNASKLVAGGTLAFGGTLVISNVGPALAAGNQFTLFSAGGTGSFTSISPASPGAGLAWNTNQLAISGVLGVVATGPSGPAYLTNSVSGNTLTLAWPAGQGWILEMQTNSLSTGLGTNWVTLVPGNAGIYTTNITINPTLPTVFYRLFYQP
jgi:autotransporter-associated beta strand protein